MFKRFQSFIDKLASHATLWPFLLGSGFMTALAGWAAHATRLLQPYAPLSWVASALTAGFLCAGIFAFYGRGKLWLTTETVRREFYKNTDRLNPLETTFRERRINILDLASPIEPVIRGKTFIDCEIIGPAIVCLSATSPGKGGMNGVAFIDCNACKVRDNFFLSNGLMFEDCTFLRGKMFRITLFIPVSGYQHIKSNMPGMLWLTPD